MYQTVNAPYNQNNKLKEPIRLCRSAELSTISFMILALYGQFLLTREPDVFHTFFFLVKTWHLHYPQYNSTHSTAEILLCYASSGLCSFELGAGYRGLLSSLLSNSTLSDSFSNL